MMSDAQIRESSALRTMRAESEARGLTFYVNPPREVVPAFLGDFQPDAMALGPDGGIIIEVWGPGNQKPGKQLGAIGRKVAGQKGWELRAIYLNPATDEVPPIAKPTQAQLEATFREIEALRDGGHLAAALVTGWAALESLARLARAEGEGRGSRAFSPIQPIQTLAEEGYIENAAADRLREMASLRNAVVHGDLSAEVPVELVDDLLGQLKAIAADVVSVMTEQPG